MKYRLCEVCYKKCTKDKRSRFCSKKCFATSRILSLKPGSVWNRLTLKERMTDVHKGMFLCSCGKDIIISIADVKSGHTKSCGCLKQETKSNWKHGHTSGGKKSREFYAWSAMRERCFNKNNNRYYAYGGRGITVCERWTKFSNFLADMGNCPINYSLDRIDTQQGYTPKNCRWADALTQANNKRTTHLITIDGCTLSIAQWVRKTGKPKSFFYNL